jgi:hypothetical protein
MNNFPTIAQKRPQESKSEIPPKKFHVDSDYEEKHDSTQKKALIGRITLLRSKESPTQTELWQISVAEKLLGPEAVAKAFPAPNVSENIPT